MAGSILQSFVSGTRQVLAVQLFISVGAVTLAGWTLGVTNELIRDRDRLQNRVIQLEGELGSHDIVVPSEEAVVETPPQPTDTSDAYPPQVGEAPPPAESAPADAPSDGVEPATDGGKPTSDGERTENTPPPPPPVATQDANNFDAGRIIASIFTPPPALANVVLHVRSEQEAPVAQRIASALTERAHVQVTIDVMPPRDPRESGYAYFDGRQSRPSSELVAQFNDIARGYQIAPWSAQLRGVALPASGEYTADRLDIVLPPLTQVRRYNRAQTPG